MLYGTRSFGLDEYLLVFVHIPKTGGVSLWESMRDCWGVEAVRWLTPENFEKIGRSKLHTLHRKLRYRLDGLNRRRRGQLAGQPQYLSEPEKKSSNVSGDMFGWGRSLTWGKSRSTYPCCVTPWIGLYPSTISILVK